MRKLPDTSSIDDMMYEINFVAQFLKGLKDAGEGRVITSEELLKRVDD